MFILNRYLIELISKKFPLNRNQNIEMISNIVGKNIKDRYKIESYLSKGSYGYVFKAIDQHDKIT